MSITSYDISEIVRQDAVAPVDWHHLAGATATLDERLDGRCRPGYTPDAVLSDRERRWRRALGDTEGTRLLEQRLANDGCLDVDRALLLGDVVWRDDRPLPTFVTVLQQAFGRTAGDTPRHFSDAQRSLSTFVATRQELPFIDLLVPLLALAKQRLTDHPHADQLAQSAVDDVLHTLALRLVQLSQQMLMTEFSRLRVDSGYDSGDMAAIGSQTVPRHLYERFIEALRDGGIHTLLARYPVMARLMGEATEQWCEVWSEFLDRLADDRTALAAALGRSTPLGALTAVSSDAGDPHDGGRAVALLTFEDGGRAVYKPRTVALDVAWQRITDRYNRSVSRSGRDLHQPAILSRDGYGWMEYVTTAPCASPEQVESFYWRSGATLALLYAVGGSDYHLENLLAHGAHPVVIDHEALVSPQPRWARTTDQTLTRILDANAALLETVLSVGLLPWMRPIPGGRAAVDMGGLKCGESESLSLKVVHWRWPNSDLMRLARTELPSAVPSNVPRLDGEPRYAGAYLDAIADGFSHGYRFALEHVDELRAILRDSRNVECRLIFRATSTYARLLQRVQHPQFATDGCARWIEFDALSRAFLGSDARPAGWDMLAFERQSLLRQNIPLFLTPVDSRDLVAPDGTRIADFFVQSALERAEARLNHLSVPDCETQLRLIRQAFAVATAIGDVEEKRSQTQWLGTKLSAAAPGSDRSSRHDRNGAAALLRRIEAHHQLRGPSGMRHWIAPIRLPRSSAHAIRPLTFAWADGLSGVALAHGAVARQTGNWQPVYDLLTPLLHEVQQGRTPGGEDLAPPSSDGFDLSLATGVAGVASSFALLGAMSGHDAFADAAEYYARKLARLQHGSVMGRSLMRGAAGTAIALLAVDRLRHSRELRECARALLAAAPHPDPSADDATWSFAYGELGTLYAHLQLARAESRSVITITESLAARLAAMEQRAVSAPDAIPVGLTAGVLGLLHVAAVAGVPWPERLTAYVFDRRRRIASDDLACGEAGRAAVAIAAGRFELTKDGQTPAPTSEALLPTGAWGPLLETPSFLYGSTGSAYALSMLDDPSIPFPWP